MEYIGAYSLVVGGLSCICAACLYASTHIVQEGEAIIIQRFGRFVNIQSAGLHFTFPFINSAKSVHWYFRYAEDETLQEIRGIRIPMNQLCYDPVPLECVTKNGITVKFDLVVHFRVQDPQKAVYNMDNTFAMLEDTVETKLRDTVSKLDYQELGQDSLNAKMSLEELNKGLENFGCALTNVRVQRIRLPKSIRNAIVETERLRLEQKAQFEKLDMERNSREQENKLKRAAQDLELEYEAKRSKHALDCLEREAALFNDPVAYFQSKHQSESMRALSAANAKVIVAPSDVIQAAGRMPLLQATRLSD